MFFVTLRGNPVRVGDCTRSCKFLYKGFCTSNVTGYKPGRQQNPERVRRPAEHENHSFREKKREGRDLFILNSCCPKDYVNNALFIINI